MLGMRLIRLIVAPLIRLGILSGMRAFVTDACQVTQKAKNFCDLPYLHNSASFGLYEATKFCEMDHDDSLSPSP